MFFVFCFLSLSQDCAWCFKVYGIWTNKATIPQCVFMLDSLPFCSTQCTSEWTFWAANSTFIWTPALIKQDLRNHNTSPEWNTCGDKSTAQSKTASYVVGFSPGYFISAIIRPLLRAVEYQRESTNKGCSESERCISHVSTHRLCLELARNFQKILFFFLHFSLKPECFLVRTSH